MEELREGQRVSVTGPGLGALVGLTGSDGQITGVVRAVNPISRTVAVLLDADFSGEMIVVPIARVRPLEDRAVPWAPSAAETGRLVFCRWLVQSGRLTG